MFEIRYDSNVENEYKFARETQEEIVQNVQNILSRTKGNVPLNRHKGIDSTLIDEPFSVVEAKLSAVIMDEIEREEPRFKVDEIIYNEESHVSGKLSVIVKGVIFSE